MQQHHEFLRSDPGFFELLSARDLFRINSKTTTPTARALIIELTDLANSRSSSVTGLNIENRLSILIPLSE